MATLGLLRLRARHDFTWRGSRYVEGDIVYVENSKDAEQLCAWGRCELTPQARERIYGRDPWPAGFRTR